MTTHALPPAYGHWKKYGASLAAALLLLMPGNPDSIAMPVEIVLPFRALSLGGLTLFWAIFGLCFGWLARRAANPRSVTALAV